MLRYFTLYYLRQRPNNPHSLQILRVEGLRVRIKANMHFETRLLRMGLVATVHLNRVDWSRGYCMRLLWAFYGTVETTALALVALHAP